MEKHLHIQAPVEEVFEPLKISWSPLLWVPFTPILTRYSDDIGCIIWRIKQRTPPQN